MLPYQLFDLLDAAGKGRDAMVQAVRGHQTNEAAATPAPDDVAARPARTDDLAGEALHYAIDAWQRAILTLNVLRQGANQSQDHAEHGKPPVLSFAYDVVLDGMTLDRPSNYLLLRIRPEQGLAVDPRKRPFIIVDPRAGHGPGISGFKPDSQIGHVLRTGHPCYFIGFRPEPVPGQTLEDVGYAEARFIDKVIHLHPEASGKPCVIGNCQAGWAVMALGAVIPDLMGPLIIAGSPLSYWAGLKGQNPMRYAGGLLGGTWMTALASDLGNGRFDGAHLVSNFERLDPANTYWKKPYNLFSKVDTEENRYLEFEKWWRGFFLLNAQEIQTIVDDLFVGNKLASGQMYSRSGYRIDLRNIRSPILVFASYGDNITPPPQALGWILDLYQSVDDIRSREQTIVYNLHHDIGHLGIFVSGKVARKEVSEFIENIDLVELLPPGLYELVLEKRDEQAPGADLTAGDFVARFEEREMNDIRALVGHDPEEDLCFATAARVSEINLGLYLSFVGPVVRGLVNEHTAAWLRALHPARQWNYWLSDKNPWMAPVRGLAESARQGRQPVDEDNPFLKIQNAIADQVVHTLDSYRDWRDAASEMVFRSIYGAPWLQAAVGLRAPGARPLRLSETHDDAYQADVEKRFERIKALVETGGTSVAVCRMMMFIGRGAKAGGADERAYRAFMRLRSELPESERTPIAEIRAMVRDQALLMRLDEAGALAALPKLLPTEKERHTAMERVRRILSAHGPLDEAHKSRLARISALLDLPPAASGEPPRAARAPEPASAKAPPAKGQRSKALV